MDNFNLKRLVFSVVFLGSFLSGIGQSINNYVFSTNNTSSLNRSAGSIVDDISLTSGFEVQIGGSINNQTGALDTIPFDFWIGGTRVTRFNATSNGWIGLVNQTASATTFASNAFSPRLAPFLTITGNNGMGTSQNGKIQTKVFGAQPNRVFVIEFLNMAINFNGTSSDSNTFQVRLYENNGAIEYVYGRMACLGGLPLNYNIGFQLNATFPAVAFQHVNTSTNTASTSVSTANVQASVGDILPLVGRTPGAQRSYTWTPTPVNDPGFITVSAITTSSMNLSWTDVSNETAYALYRSTDGGATYTFQAQFLPNTTSFLATNLIANTTYDWRVYAVRESISAPGDGSGTTLPASKFFTTSGGNWNDPLIWNTLAVPSGQDSAEITTGHVVTLDAATISSGTLIVNGTLNYWNTNVLQTFNVNGDVIVNATGTFTAGTGTGAAAGPHVLNIGGNTTASVLPGNLVVNGTFDMLTTASVQTVFFGTSNGTITGTGPTCEMPFISVTKGGVAPFAVDNTLEILRVITQPNATSTFTNTQRLVATSGTLKISAALVFNSLHTNQVTLASAAGSRFWLNNGSANIGTVTGAAFQQLNLTGELRIDNGTLGIGVGNSNHFANGTAVIRLNGGTLNLLGGLNITNLSTSQLIIAGGRLTLDPQATSNLSQFASVLNVPSASTFTMTSGSIEIVDPHSVGGGTSITITAGGVKSVTGGTFVIGNTLAAPSGGVFATNSGFGLNIGIPIHNLTLSNNISINTSRQCRLLAALTVNGNLTLDADAFLITGSVATGAVLNVLGNIVNNGIISGTSPGLSAPPGIGSLNLTGITAQGVSGSGTTNLLTLRIANASGVNFTNTGTWALENVTLESGNVTNTGTNIQIGAATYRGRITIGGLNETTASGSFSALPSIISTFGAPSYVYGPSSTTLQTGSFNEMPSGAQTLFNLTVNDAQGVVSNRNITVTGTLALTLGNLNVGTNNISVGLSAAAPGTLARTSGFVRLGTNGTFTRWYNTAISPAFDYASGFPISSISGERSVLFSLNGGTFTTGGNITVRHTDVIGFTDVTSFVDGSTTINRRTNSFWTLSSSSIPVISTTLSLRLVGAGIGAVSDVTQLKVVKITSAAGGTTQVGSGTNSIPEANRDFSNANLSGGAMFDDFFIGTNSGINPLSPTIIAILTGNWNETSTWQGGIIPDITNSATIAPGVNVTIPTGITAACNGLSINAGGTLTATSGTLNSASSILIDGTMNANGTTVNVVSTATNGITVNSGGTLSVSAGNVNIGPTGGGNNRLTNNGTFTVSGGNVNINGNLVIASGSSFNQSGGDINIDGNSGLAGTSVSTGTHLCFILSNTLNCSGGNITIIDPPHNSLSPNTMNALRIQVTSGSLTAFTGTHTLRLGDGTSTETGNTNGFSLNTRSSTGIIPLQNVTVNGGNGSGRWASSSFTSGTGTHIKGNVGINTNSEFRHTFVGAPLAIGGDINNNGIFTSSQSFILGGLGYVINNAQAISGTGTFRNATSSPTAEFTSVTLDNGVGLTLNSTNQTYRFSGTLTITALNVTTNSNSIVVSNTGLSRTSGYIIGNLGKTLTVGANVARTYEIGNATNFLPVTVTFPSVTTAGNVVIGITNGDHPQLGSSCINAAKSINRFWTITNNGTVTTGGNYTFNFLAGDVDGGTVLGSAKLFSFDGSAWQAGLTPSGTTSTSYTVNGLNNYGAVAIGEITPVPTSVVISTPSTNICVGTSVTFTAVVTNGGSTPTFQWKINGGNVGTGLSTFTTSSLANNDAVTCEIVSNSPCVVVPNATSNTINMTVSPLTVGGAVAGGTTICSGSTSGVLTLSGHTGSVVRWESSTSPTFTTVTTIANTTTTLTSGPLTATTFFRAVVKSGACAEANSTSTTVTVDVPSVAGTINGNSAVCAGGAVGNLTLTGSTGTVVRWESSNVAPFTTFTPITNTTTTQDGGSPTVTTHFRAVVANGSCPSATTTAFIVTVTPASVGGSVTGSQTICAGGAVTALTLSGATGSVTKWQSATNVGFTVGVADIANTTTTLTPSPSPSVTTFYRAVVQNGSCPVANSNAATITVNPAPVGGIISGSNNVCTGSSPGTLTLSGHTGTIDRWQTSVSPFTAWTDISNTNTTLNPGILTVTRAFRAVLTSVSCPDAFATPLIVTVNPLAVGGAVSGNQTICSGGAVTALTLSGQTGTISGWQSSPNVGFTTPTNIAGTAGLTSFTPTSPTVTTFYRAVLTSGSCPNAFSTSASITVDPAAVGGAVSGNQTICSGGAVTALTLSGQTGTISGWQSATDAGFTTPTNIAGTAGLTSFTPTSPIVTTFYRAVLTGGSCPTAFSSPASITVNPSAVGGTVSGSQTICSGGAVTALTLSGQTGTISGWQSATDAGFTTPTNIAGTAGLTSFTPTSPIVTTFYRVVMTSGSCPSANSGSATITVTPSAVGGTINGSSAVCSGSNTNLSLTGQTGTIVKWQFADNAPLFNNWADIANTTTSLTTAALTQTTRYRVEVASGLCPSAFSNEFEVTVTSGGIWVGVINGNWNNPANWCGGVPNATTNVVISAGTPFSPIINVGAVANNVTVDAGATLVFTGTTNSIDIRGNLVVNGTFTTTGGTVNFGAATPQSVAGITYERLQLSGGGVKTLAGNATVTTQLNLTFGNLELSSFNLTLAGTVLGGGSTSHVTTNGTGRYTINNVGAASQIFHIGSGGSYLPVTIANNGTTDNISVKVLNGVFASYTGEVGTGAITADVVNKTFIINEAAAGGSSLNITFQWNTSDEQLPSYDRSQTIVGYFNGGAWSNLTGATGVPASGTNPFTFTILGVTNLGIFGLGDLQSPLPIKLVAFNAKLDDGVTKLVWTTASEINTSHFEIERGTDGYNFEYVDELKSRGNSSSRIDYHYDDKNAGKLMQTNNVIYYRLKTVDYSGHQEYSKVVSVSEYGNMPFKLVSTVPNPFKSETNISFKTGSTADIEIVITDAFGREVSKSKFTPALGANVIPVGVDNNWKSGVYFAKLTQDGETLSVKIVKQ